MTDATPTESQTYEARELAVAYCEQFPRTLPTYAWMRGYSATVRAMSQDELIAFGRIAIDTCKTIHNRRGHVLSCGSVIR